MADAEQTTGELCDRCRLPLPERLAYLDGLATGLELAAADFAAFERERAELAGYRRVAEERGLHMSADERAELDRVFGAEHEDDDDAGDL